jgi:hypothetical protein
MQFVGARLDPNTLRDLETVEASIDPRVLSRRSVAIRTAIHLAAKSIKSGGTR